ncbi:MAG: hypothetical protein NTZ02_00545 [Candidatus Woesearchaeota archaeon]|nr:hypothetical protein [Candidatus Woesearchaeota archaeon]
MEKKMLLLAIMVVALIAILPGVMAASLAVNPSSITIGGSDVTYQRDGFYIASFTITNTGSDNLTGISVSASNVNSRYNVTFFDVLTVIQPNDSQTITVSAYIPDDQNAAVQKIGNIIVKSNSNTPLISIPLNMQAANMLDVYGMSVSIDGSSETIFNSATTSCTDSCSDNIDKNAKPGSTVTLTIKLKNDFQDISSDRIDINNIEIDSLIEGIDNGDDLSPTDLPSSFDLAPQKKTTKTLTFEIPQNAQEDTYTIYVDITGDDDNGATHEGHWKLQFDLNQEAHSLLVTAVDPSQLQASTCNRVVPLSVTVLNIGRNDEKNAVVTVENSQLGMGLKNGFSVNSGDSYASQFDIVVPQNAIPATYNLVIRTYYEYSHASSISSVPLVVSACQQAENITTPTQPQQNATVIQQPVIPPSGEGAAVAKQVPFTESTAFMVLLVVGVVALLIIIFIIIARLIR